MRVTYTIGTLSALTGLSAHTIRAWERRYHVLSPDRSDTNRRVYTEADLERLSLLKRAVDAGHSIGHVAPLPNDRLAGLGANPAPPSHGTPSHLNACLAAIERLDPEGLADALVRANAALGVMEMLEEVAIPLLAAIEVGWMDGSIRIAQEHMASAVLREHLQRVRASMPGKPPSPRLLVTTPRHQHHEFGALMASIVAAMQSWSVTYLGPNLPIEEIVAAARMSGARAVALSLVFPVDDERLPDELRSLRAEVGPRLPILVGGRAAEHYQEVLAEIHAQRCPDLTSFRDALDAIAPTRAVV